MTLFSPTSASRTGRGLMRSNRCSSRKRTFRSSWLPAHWGKKPRSTASRREPPITSSRIVWRACRWPFAAPWRKKPCAKNASVPKRPCATLRPATANSSRMPRTEFSRPGYPEDSVRGILDEFAVAGLRVAQGLFGTLALLAQRLFLQGAANGHRQAGQTILEDVIGGSPLDAVDRGFFPQCAGNQDERNIFFLLLQDRKSA